MGKPRAVTRTARFRRELEGHQESDPRLEEAIQGVEVVLSRLAEHGMSVRGTDLDSWPVHTPAGRTYRVFYTHTNNEVALLSLRELELPERRY